MEMTILWRNFRFQEVYRSFIVVSWSFEVSLSWNCLYKMKCELIISMKKTVSYEKWAHQKILASKKVMIQKKTKYYQTLNESSFDFNTWKFAFSSLANNF